MTSTFPGPCASSRESFRIFRKSNGSWACAANCAMDAVQGISSVTPVPTRRNPLWSVPSPRARLYHAGSLLLASKSLRERWAASRLTGRSQAIIELVDPLRRARRSRGNIRPCSEDSTTPGKNRSLLNVEIVAREEVSAIRSRIPAPLRTMGDRLVQRKRLAEKFLFRTARICGGICNPGYA